MKRATYMSIQLHREKLPAKHNAELYPVCAMHSLATLTASEDSPYDFTIPYLRAIHKHFRRQTPQVYIQGKTLTQQSVRSLLSPFIFTKLIPK